MQHMCKCSSIHVTVTALCVRYWSRHLTVTIPQPTMNYESYPLDTQNFTFVLQSFAYDYKFVSLSFIGNTAVKLLTNPEYSDPMITLNQLWTYETFSSYVYLQAAPSLTNPTRQYSTAVINITFTRKKYGSLTASHSYSANLT